MKNEINPIEEDFNAALSRYKAGQDLIPIAQDFQKIIQQIPNHFAAWTCLSWLQLLLKNNEEALAAASYSTQLRQARSRLKRSIQTPTNQVIPIDLNQLVDRQLWSSGPPQPSPSGNQAKGMTLLQLSLQQAQERDKRPHHCNARSKGEVVIHCHGLGSLHWLRRQTQGLT